MDDHDRSGSYSYGGKSHNNASNSNDMQLQTYRGGGHELRSYSASYSQAQTSSNFHGGNKGRDFKLKKGKSTSGSASNSWSIADPEFQRKTRVASYKMYGVEGKVKGSFRKSFRWLKDRYARVVYGWC